MVPNSISLTFRILKAEINQESGLQDNSCHILPLNGRVLHLAVLSIVLVLKTVTAIIIVWYGYLAKLLYLPLFLSPLVSYFNFFLPGNNFPHM